MATEKRLIAYDPITFEAFTRSIIKHRVPYDHYDDGYIDAVERIEEWLEQNTVDAVPVVRCKDCKYSHDHEINRNYRCHRHARDGYSQVFDATFTDNDFCSYGERRTNERKDD